MKKSTLFEYLAVEPRRGSLYIRHYSNHTCSNFFQGALCLKMVHVSLHNLDHSHLELNSSRLKLQDLKARAVKHTALF